jgi:hypothetical protein
VANKQIANTILKGHTVKYTVYSSLGFMASNKYRSGNGSVNKHPNLDPGPKPEFDPGPKPDPELDPTKKVRINLDPDSQHCETIIHSTVEIL